LLGGNAETFGLRLGGEHPPRLGRAGRARRSGCRLRVTPPAVGARASALPPPRRGRPAALIGSVWTSGAGSGRAARGNRRAGAQAPQPLSRRERRRSYRVTPSPAGRHLPAVALALASLLA